MKTKLLLMAASVILISIGFYLVLDFYHNVITPLNMSQQMLQVIQTSSEPELISSLAKSMKEYLPTSGNPVWIYPTEATNFQRIQSDLDRIIFNINKVSTLPNDTSAFHTGILDIHHSSNMINENLNDAKPYLYVSIPNLLFNLIWLLGILGFNESLIKRMY